MHIRKLELHGFKSFPNRTSFHFGRGISGVVGPNGCGKSNIVDAVKWCLGEQRPKSLRGQSMADVIFAGSEGRNPMGSAEVTLHFDADDEPFPGEWAHHSELSITRRLFRNGNSEYLINHQKCRLRDIQELFMDSGAANRLYSFIEQGRIGEIVNARPEQRRTLIEEAAGISRYKAKRKEAEGRLTDTTDNLERVADSTGQMASQMRRLERQVSKAMRYRRLKSFARQAEIFLSLSRYAGLTADRRALTEQLQRANQDEEGLVRDVQRRDEGLRAGREQVDVLDTAVAQLRDELAELEASRREQESARQYQAKEKSDLEQRRGELSAQVEEADQNRQAAEDRLAGAAQDRQVAEERVAAIEKGLEGSRAAVRDAEATVRARRDGIERRKQAVMERVRALARSQAELEGAQQRIQELGERGARLRAAQGVAGRDLSVLDEQVQGVAAEVDQAAGALEAARGVARDQQAALRQAEKDRHAAEQAQRAAAKAFQAAERDENRLKTRLEGLQAMQDEHTGVEDAVREALAVDGVIGTLAEHLQVPADLDAPVVAALGESLDAVLVPDAVVAAAVAARVDGRVRVLVVSGESGPLAGPLASISGDAGAVGAVARLLGPCGAAEDVASALAHHAATGESCLVRGAAAFVARSGELLLGRPGTAGSAALARQRDMDAIAVQLEDLIQKTSATADAAEAATSARDAADAALEAARGTAGAARDATLHAELTQTDARRRHADRVREREREGARATQVAKELGSVDTSKVQAESSVAALKQRIRAAGDEQSTIESELQIEQQTLSVELGALNRARDGLNARASEAAALRERLVGLRRTETEVLSARDGASKQAERARREGDAASTRIHELTADDTRLSTTLGGLTERITHVGGTLDARREEARAERASLRAGEEALAKLRERREGATRHRGDLERRLHDVKTEVGLIRDDLQERFELSVSGMLDRLDRVGHVVVEVDPAARREDLPEAARPDEADARMLVDLRITPDQIDEPDVVETWKAELQSARDALARLGEVNLVAMVEYEEVAARFNELDAQRADLEESVASIRKTIARLNRISRERFRDTFDRVDASFREIYPRLVGGGQARLELTDEEDMLETGVDISVQPPGKRLQNLSLLSGGETAMVAIALIFSLFRVKPSPFCLLDEVDAPLDEGNGARFNLMLGEMAALSQFIVVTHNKKTMEAADTLYGVTMDTPGVSRLVSVQLD